MVYIMTLKKRELIFSSLFWISTCAAISGGLWDLLARFSRHQIITVWVLIVTRKLIISPSQNPTVFLLMNITRTSVCWMIQGLLVITWNIWAILNQSRPDSKYSLKGSLYWPQAECCRPHHGISGQDPFPSNVMLTRWIRAGIQSQPKVSQWH